MKICSVCDSCFEDSEDFCLDPAHGELKDGPHPIDVVPGYRIERLIASFPTVVSYQAKQIEYGQGCVISISIANGDSKQFLADARIAAALFHAGVASVVESGELSNGSAFAVFEGSAGTSLRDILSDGSLSLLDRIRITRHAAEAIHAIHSAGLTHGAIRPENVSIDGIGTEELSVKVHNIDLGSAFAGGVLSNRFAMDSSLDLLRYFAPERFRGEAPTVQSDVYSLGLLLYEILSGHPPFEAASASALADMHLNQKPPEIKIENFDLRMLLTHTIYESLQKRASFRQSTADLFARQMRHIEQLATHVSTPPPAVAVAAAPSSVSRPISTPYVRPEPQRVSIPPVEVAAPIEFFEEVLIKPFASTIEVPNEAFVERIVPVIAPVAYVPTPIEKGASVAAAIELPEVLVEHFVPVPAPVAYVPTPTKRSRLKGMKKRLQSHISDAKEALSPKPTPTLIDWNQPADDIPSIDAVRQELTLTGGMPSFEEDEEITHVRAVERIEVDWSEPVRIEKPEIAAEFFPTLVSMQGSSKAENASMFGGYQSQGRGVGRLPIYAVGAFAMILIGFGFFRLASALSDDSDAYIGEYRPTPVQIPASVTRAEPVEELPAVVNIPAQPISLPAAVPQSDVDESSGTRLEDPVPVKAVAKAAAKEPQKSTRTIVSEPAPIIVGQSSAKATPIVPSTLVITRGTGKTRSTVVARTSTQKPKVIVVGSGATRPRIVTLPN